MLELTALIRRSLIPNTMIQENLTNYIEAEQLRVRRRSGRWRGRKRENRAQRGSVRKSMGHEKVHVSWRQGSQTCETCREKGDSGTDTM
jgi:hypothetical protein